MSRALRRRAISSGCTNAKRLFPSGDDHALIAASATSRGSCPATTALAEKKKREAMRIMPNVAMTRDDGWRGGCPATGATDAGVGSGDWFGLPFFHRNMG